MIAEDGSKKARSLPGGCAVSRRVTRVGDAVLSLEQSVEVQGEKRGIDATGGCWMLAAVEVRAGAIEYLTDDGSICPDSAVFGIAAPPHAVIHTLLRASVSHSISFVAASPVPPGFPAEPSLFAMDLVELPCTAGALASRLAADPGTIRVGTGRHPGRLAAETKQQIDMHFADPGPLSAVAARLGTSPPAMSRAFRRAYGLPPVTYRHLVRTMDAMMKLVQGMPIIDVCHDTGFDDLSRFYAQFRRFTLTPPSTYRF